MIVYRVCKEEEYYQILCDKDFVNIGRCFNKEETKTMNTHNYKENTRYLQCH